MLTRDLLAYVRASLPPAPARLLEIGAGRGELARALSDAGYSVRAIDPAAEPGTGVEPITLLEADGCFQAAVAIVALHHVSPLPESVAHLATLLLPGAPLVVDELDSDRYDERATGWWIAQRRLLGPAGWAHHHPGEPGDHAEPGDQAQPGDQAEPDAAGLIAQLRAHVHSLAAVQAALRPRFDLGPPVRGPYLHRWELRESLREAEIDLIADGLLPAVGARFVAFRLP